MVYKHKVWRQRTAQREKKRIKIGSMTAGESVDILKTGYRSRKGKLKADRQKDLPKSCSA